METKKEIRKQLRKIRNQLEPNVWQRATEKITSNVIQSDLFREATDLLCYMNIEGEVGTHQIIEEAWRLGKNVWVPKVSGEDMEFYCMHSFSELEEGVFGVPEPSGESEKAELKYGLMIVPGVAFDRMHNRIGYGKGFYDRYMKAHPDMDTMGIAFDVQILERIQTEECDQPLDMVITETLTF